MSEKKRKSIKSAKKKMTDKEQYQHFLKHAQKLQNPEGDKLFESTVKALAKKKGK